MQYLHSESGSGSRRYFLFKVEPSALQSVWRSRYPKTGLKLEALVNGITKAERIRTDVKKKVLMELTLTTGVLVTERVTVGVYVD